MRELYHCRFAAEESVARQILFALWSTNERKHFGKGWVGHTIWNTRN